MTTPKIDNYLFWPKWKERFFYATVFLAPCEENTKHLITGRFYSRVWFGGLPHNCGGVFNVERCGGGLSDRCFGRQGLTCRGLSLPAAVQLDTQADLGQVLPDRHNSDQFHNDRFWESVLLYAEVITVTCENGITFRIYVLIVNKTTVQACHSTDVFKVRPLQYRMLTGRSVGCLKFLLLSWQWSKRLASLRDGISFVFALQCHEWSTAPISVYSWPWATRLLHSWQANSVASTVLTWIRTQFINYGGTRSIPLGHLSGWTS